MAKLAPCTDAEKGVVCGGCFRPSGKVGFRYTNRHWPLAPAHPYDVWGLI
jgi:hypothetical protein